jgi:hypothetical protein
LENPKRPEEERRGEIREMLRNMVRAELRRNGGFDPGLKVVTCRIWSVVGAYPIREAKHGNDEDIDLLQEEHLQALMQVDDEQAQRVIALDFGRWLPDEDMNE